MAPLGNPQLKQSIIEQKDKEITALQAQLADREAELAEKKTNLECVETAFRLCEQELAEYKEILDLFRQREKVADMKISMKQANEFWRITRKLQAKGEI